jgi:hypothetical protein
MKTRRIMLFIISAANVKQNSEEMLKRRRKSDLIGFYRSAPILRSQMVKP